MINNPIRQKRIAAALLLSFILTLIIPLGVQAADVLWDSYEIPSSRQKERVYDGADLLTDSEESTLLDTLDSLSEQWQCNIVVLTTDSHNGPIQAYADDYFDYNGFCTEFDESGVLFMLSMEDRSWAISTSGSAQYAFTDYGQEYMVDEMLPYLKDGDYYEAFNKYADISDMFLNLYSQGTPFDVDYEPPKTTGDYIRQGIISAVIGMILALLPILGMWADLNNVKLNENAAGYSTKGVNLTSHEDRFINKTLTKTAKPKDTERSSSGGSSLHTSSSGHSHGGSSGHF